MSLHVPTHGDVHAADLLGEEAARLLFDQVIEITRDPDRVQMHRVITCRYCQASLGDVVASDDAKRQRV